MLKLQRSRLVVGIGRGSDRFNHRQRSLKIIRKTDLRKLLDLAREDNLEFFKKNPLYRRMYQGKEVLIALCQGAALHFVDRENGVKDFDVWFFYPKKREHIPYRRRGVKDFGKSRFGKHPASIGYEGRSVDVLMRSDGAFDGISAREGIEKYLREKKTKSARLLSRKAVIGLYPESVFGETLWHKASS